MINLLNLEPNKVSTDLTQYTYVLMGEFGVGKTPVMHKFLTEISPEGKVPLFLMFEDRYQHVSGITAIRIRNIADLKAVANQLKNPKAREKFSGICIDTFDSYEKMVKGYVATNKEVEIAEDIGFGRGKHYLDGQFAVLREISNLGITMHYIIQGYEKEDIMSKTKTVKSQLTDASKTQVYHGAYLVGLLKKEFNGDLIATFKKDSTNLELKNSFNLPDKIKVADLKKEIEKAVRAIDPNNSTSERTVVEIGEIISLEELTKKGTELGSLLAKNGYLEEALNILKINIGIKVDGNVKMLDDLVDAQRDLAEVVVLKLEELVDKYKLSDL